MKTIWKIIIGIPSAAAAIAIIGGLYLYFDSIRNKPLNKEEVKEIVKTEVAPLADQIFFQWDMLKNISSNQDLLKQSVYGLIRKDNRDSMQGKIDRVYNFLNEWKTTEVKKNSLLILLKPKE